MQNNERLNPDAAMLKGIEAAARPVDLRIHEIGSRPSYQNETNMLALADSLNKFANGTMAIDRAARLQGEKRAREIYLQQKEQNRQSWNKIAEKVPFASRLNPYTKDYYNDLVAEQIAQRQIATMTRQFTKEQIATKSPEEVEKFFTDNKQALSEALNQEGLAPSNAIKAIESFEIAKTATTREYLPANAEYNYKKGLGVLREKIYTEVHNLDLNNLKPAEKVEALSATIQKVVTEAHNNGVIAEDIAEQLGYAMMNHISSIIDDDIEVLDDKEIMAALGQIKIGDRNLKEIVPNFNEKMHNYIDQAYDSAINRAGRASKLEETKTKNAFVFGTKEIADFTATLSGNLNSAENSQKIKAFIENLCKHDPYYNRNKGVFYEFAFSTNRAQESFTTQYSNRGMVANFLYEAAFNPGGVSTVELYNALHRGDIDMGSYKTVLDTLEQAKKGALNAELQLLTSTYGEQKEIITKDDSIDPEFKQELLNKLFTKYVHDFRELASPYNQNLKGFDNYSNFYKELTTDLPEKSKKFEQERKANQNIQTLQTIIDKNKPIISQGMFKNVMYYNQYSSIDTKPKSTGAFKANQNVSWLINQKVTVTSPYGKVRSDGTKHGGVDLAAGSDKLGKNTLVVNVAGKGYVQKGYQKDGAGKFVYVRMKNNPDCGYYVMHLNNYVDGLLNGMEINPNTPLGYMGNTGHVIGTNGSDGTHTHVQYTYKGKAVSEDVWRRHLGI